MTLEIINNYLWIRLSVRIIGAIKRQFLHISIRCRLALYVIYVFVFFLGGEGFIATVFFKLALPLCGDLNVLVM